eukprot:TRINITY_DN7409_c0_g1_i1.p1 TRINITY_DN7409_c0_g1~~TRINITY_DN7409_c0_g1_i1.p1  ORF type:complete len:292 (-),score=18.15 TRINITY_DN7409_c0_g1_i1:189-1064(-)
MDMSEWFYEQPNSLYLRLLEAAVVFSGVVLGYMEFKDIHLKYSKFSGSKGSAASSSSFSLQISSKWGMFWFYFPAFVISLCFILAKLFWPWTSPLLSKLGLLDVSLSLQLDRPLRFRFLVTAAAVTLHFFKRIYEVLLIHRFSGTSGIGTIFFISSMYAFNAIFFLAALQISESLRPPSLNLFRFGIILFFIGLTGNFYHHYILSTLRKDGVKEYFIPEAGLFKLVVCPHYLFEIIGIAGLALMSQTVFGVCTLAFVFCYLLGRSLSTKAWYLKKFDNFPSHRKALIPFLV